MIFYLTYNDAPSGIFSSQVIDVVKYLNKELKADIKLVSFVSIRDFFKNKKKIQAELPEAIVLPMFPGVHRWKLNVFILFLLALIYKPTVIMGRSVLATQLALRIKKKSTVKQVVYDGRGAISAEWKEYGVITHPKMLQEIDELESQVVNESDFRIAVSEQLVSYWQTQYNYKLSKHVIIPCTLNPIFENVDVSENSIKKSRDLLGFKADEIIFVYSGSIAGWQSFELLNDFLNKNLASSSKHKVLFLSEMDKHISELQKKFPLQVLNKKVHQTEVPNYLLAGDYGILIREQSITNKVASPVKFAEYLCCGLGIIISENLGDYSSFVSNEQCGLLVDQFAFSNYNKAILNKIALSSFTKKSHIHSYQTLINQLTTTS